MSNGSSTVEFIGSYKWEQSSLVLMQQTIMFEQMFTIFDKPYALYYVL